MTQWMEVGEKERKGDEKGIKMYYERAPMLHNACKHCVLQTSTN